MNELFQKYGIHLFTALVTIFISMVGWVIKEYYANQKKVDETQSKAVNGLGERLNKTLDRIEKELREFRLEMKSDIKEVSQKVDNAIDGLHDVEKRIIVKGYEEELKKIKGNQV